MPWSKCEKWLTEAEKELQEGPDGAEASKNNVVPTFLESGIAHEDYTLQAVTLESPNVSLVVSRQVTEFVKSILDPLSRAGVVNQSVYETTLKKTVEKVMSLHKGRSNADFLIREGSSIRKLAEEYVMYCKGKGL